MCILLLVVIMDVLFRLFTGGMKESWYFSVANCSFLAPAISE